MINRKAFVLLSVLVVTIALMIVVNLSVQSGTETVIEAENTITTDDVVDELEITLLDEESSVEIGEMI